MAQAGGLDAIRERATAAAPELHSTFRWEEQIRPVRASARDVQALLNIIDTVTPLIVAARSLVLNFDDVDSLGALVEAAEELPWATLNSMGIIEEDA